MGGCTLFTPEFAADVSLSDWQQRACNPDALTWPPLYLHVDLTNTGQELLEYIQIDFEIDVSVTGLNASELETLDEDLICLAFENDVCTLDFSEDWLILLEPDERTWRDVRFGGDGDLRRFVERSDAGLLGAVLDVRIGEYRFWRYDPSG